MDLDLYLRYVEVTLSRYALLELLDIWITSLAFGHLGVQIRNDITQAVPNIAQTYNFPQTTSFQELVEQYETHTFHNACPEDLNYALIFFVKEKNFPAVRYCLRKGANKYFEAAKVAIQVDSLLIFEYLLPRCMDRGEELYLCACKYRRREMVTLLQPLLEKICYVQKTLFLGALYLGDLATARRLEEARGDWYRGHILKAAVLSGNTEIVHCVLSFYNYELTHFRSAVRKAAKYNYTKIIEILTKKAYVEHDVFIGAAAGGHVSLIQELGPKVGNALNTGAAAIRAAARRNDVDLIKLIVSYCPYTLSYAVSDAFLYEAWSVLDYLVANGVHMDWDRAVVLAAETGSRKLVDFCLTHANIDKKYLLCAANRAQANGYPTLKDYLLK